jgi:cysteine-rich PDZ-binding protein
LSEIEIEMVCEDCQRKQLNPLIIPDRWKEGARSVAGSAGGAAKTIKTNKALEKKKFANQWIPEDRNCRLCKAKVLAHMHYCNNCSYKRGICAGCGKKVIDVSSYKMSTV